MCVSRRISQHPNQQQQPLKNLNGTAHGRFTTRGGVLERSFLALFALRTTYPRLFPCRVPRVWFSFFEKKDNNKLTHAQTQPRKSKSIQLHRSKRFRQLSELSLKSTAHSHAPEAETRKSSAFLLVFPPFVHHRCPLTARVSSFFPQYITGSATERHRLVFFQKKNNSPCSFVFR